MPGSPLTEAWNCWSSCCPLSSSSWQPSEATVPGNSVFKLNVITINFSSHWFYSFSISCLWKLAVSPLGISMIDPWLSYCIPSGFMILSTHSWSPCHSNRATSRSIFCYRSKFSASLGSSSLFLLIRNSAWSSWASITWRCRPSLAITSSKIS